MPNWKKSKSYLTCLFKTKNVIGTFVSTSYYREGCIDIREQSA